MARPMISEVTQDSYLYFEGRTKITFFILKLKIMHHSEI
jgi:hypothetical protein